MPQLLLRGNNVKQIYKCTQFLDITVAYNNEMQ